MMRKIGYSRIYELARNSLIPKAIHRANMLHGVNCPTGADDQRWKAKWSKEYIRAMDIFWKEETSKSTMRGEIA